MPIDRTDPDEVDEVDEPARGSRRRLPLAVGAVVALAVAAVVAVVVRRGGDTARTPDTTASTTTTTLAAVDTVPVDGVALDGFPDNGSDYAGSQMLRLYDRTTEAGIEVHLRSSQLDPEMTMPTVANGWAPPAWCNPAGWYRLTATYRDATSTMSGPMGPPRAEVNATLHSGGFAEAMPFRVLVVSTTDAVNAVAVHWDDGATDAAETVDGWVVLAVPGVPSGTFTLTVRTADGEHDIGWRELGLPGDRDWQKHCNPPPPELPPAGEQPVDPAAAEQEIGAAFQLLFDTDVPFEDKGAKVLDDTTGVAEAQRQLAAGGFAEVAATARYVMGELVFVSPTEAWFRYDLLTSVSNFLDRFGIAYRIDGSWRISRVVVCQDLALAGVECQPPVQAITPQPVPATAPLD